jgi:hypothetical protein
MPDNIIQGTITDQETGESFEVEHCLFLTGSELTAIVKISEVNSYVHPDQSLQVSVDCLALDSFGFVFQLNMNFTPDLIEGRDQLLRDLRADSLLIVKGKYTVGERTPPFIILHDPAYQPVPPGISEAQIRQAFEVNQPKANLKSEI